MAQNKDLKYTAWWIFFPIAIGMGTIAGFLFGNVGLGMVVGVAVGTPLNLTFYYLHNKSLQDPQT